MALTVYKASAGSGKTFTLAAEYIKYLIINPKEYRYILAVTFTNKATAEMKERIIYYLNDIVLGSPNEEDFLDKIKAYDEVKDLGLSDKQIRQRAEEALTGILHDYSRFRIETIDSFFQSVVRELAHELDLTANLRVDLNDNEVLADAVNSIIEDVEHDKSLFGVISEFIEDKTEDSKNWHINSELEGFGKNIFNEKYLQLGQAAREEIGNSKFLIEYKKKLIQIRKEALDIIESAGKKFMDTCTAHGYDENNFKGKGRGIYSFFKKAYNGNLDINATALKCAEKTSEWTAKGETDAKLLDLVSNKFHKLLTDLIKDKDKLDLQIATPTVLLKHINHLMLLNVINTKVRNLNQDANRFLLADTAHFLNELIDGSDIPFIYEKMGTRFNHIMIDEFQDTSSLQWKNFTPLISNCLSNNDSCLIVGDVKQSIYRWRNSDWQILNDIENSEFKGYVHPENLDTNYRSVENIINFNNAFFKNAVKELNRGYNQQFEYISEDLENAYADVKQNIAKYNDGMGFVCVRAISKTDDITYSDATLDEMALIIRDLLDKGISQNEITILIRVNKHIPTICEYFTRHKDIVNVDILSDEAFRLDFSSAINMIIMALRYLADQKDKFALSCLAYYYKREVKEEYEDDINKIFIQEEKTLLNILPEEFVSRIDELTFLPLLELVEQIYKTLKLDSIQKQDAYMFSFHDKLTEYCNDNKTDLHSFLQFWDTNLCSCTIPSNAKDGIRIMSIHKSKGLAFPTVIMPYCDWKTAGSKDNLLWCKPNETPYNDLQLAPVNFEDKLNNTIFSQEYKDEVLRNDVDNLNLLYVGFTRAENNLIIITDTEKINKSGDTKKTKKEEESEDKQTKPIVKDIAQLLAFSMPDFMEKQEDEDGKTTIWTSGEILSNEHKKIIKEERKRLNGDVKEKKENKVKNVPVSANFQYFDTIIDYRQSNKSSNFIDNEDNNDPMSFIDKGLLYHSILEHIETSDDINNSIDKAIEIIDKEGCFNDNKEKEETRKNLYKAFENKQVLEWYSPEWDVFNERSIIYTSKDSIATDRRPDRVIALPNKEKAIVIDYKTGAEHASKYEKQVKLYKRLLSEMGYKNVKGFIWYILEDKIEEIK